MASPRSLPSLYLKKKNTTPCFSTKPGCLAVWLSRALDGLKDRQVLQSNSGPPRLRAAERPKVSALAAVLNESHGRRAGEGGFGMPRHQVRLPELLLLLLLLLGAAAAAGGEGAGDGDGPRRGAVTCFSPWSETECRRRLEGAGLINTDTAACFGLRKSAKLQLLRQRGEDGEPKSAATLPAPSPPPFALGRTRRSGLGRGCPPRLPRLE